MTKLAIMSDLHIDLNQFDDFEIQTLIDTLNAEKISHLHLAGDISNHFYDISYPFLETMSKHFDVTYNLGNHDMLDLDDKVIDDLDFQIIPLGQKTLLAFHGWYDYSFFPEKSEAETIKFKNTFWFDRRLNRNFSDKELTRQITQKLDRTLSTIANDVIVSLHFVPHHQFTLQHERFKPFNAFLGSQVFHDIFKKHQVNDVIFGHTHHSIASQQIDNITYYAKPLGYIREWDLTIDYVNQYPELNPNQTWNLSKRYNIVKKLDDFIDYKRQNLAQEFRKSMTIFEL